STVEGTRMRTRSRSVRRARATKVCTAVMASVAAVWAVGLSAVPAAAAVSCVVAAPTMTITLSAPGDAVALSLSGTSDPRTIDVTPSPGWACDGNQTGTITTIQVNGSGGSQTLTIDQTGSGPVPPRGHDAR